MNAFLRHYAQASLFEFGIDLAGQVAAGCISAVVRQGFVCGDDVLRTAEVVIEERVQ